MVKVVKNNLEIEKSITDAVKTFIPLDKLNLILCISLYILYNLKKGKIIVNSANINLIHNLICFRLYNNVEYDEKLEPTNYPKHPLLINLKEEVIRSIRKSEEAQMRNEDEVSRLNNYYLIIFNNVLV